jgi:hypothetical protein
MEDLVHRWVFRHAPHVTRDQVEVLIDNAADIIRDNFAGVFCPTNDDTSSPYASEDVLRWWASLE